MPSHVEKRAITNGPFSRHPSRERDGDCFGERAAMLAGMAARLLGWRPDEFWRATPAELAAVLRAMAGEDGAPPSPSDLARLMEMFPDG